MGNRVSLVLFALGAALTALLLSGLLLVRHGQLDALLDQIDLLSLASLVGGILPALAWALHHRLARRELVQTRQQLQAKLEESNAQLTSLQDLVETRQDQRALNDRTSLELTTTTARLEQVEKDLERLKDSYRDLYHHSPVMYFSLDPHGRLVTFNDTLLRILGYHRDDLQDHSYQDLLSPTAAETWKLQIQGSDKAATHPLAREGELETQWRKKDGAFIEVWIRTVAVRDHKGRVVRFRSSALDLTERHRLAHEVNHRGDELERTNARLRTIIQELEEFSHVVSHDLKEPLRTIQAFSHILAEDYAAQLGADGFQYINHLLTASRRLGSLIDDLLTLSQAGLITSSPLAFHFNEVIATVRRDLAHLVQRKGAKLIVDNSLPEVIGDQRRITQLLANLVGNGLKYNSSPKPVVTIGQTPGDPEDHRRVTLYVRDNGIGIDARYHQQIFGLFRRLHPSEEFEGTGAGLAICKKIVEAHCGRIWVESEPGKGTTFYFSLPRPQPMPRKSTPAAKPNVEPAAAVNGAPVEKSPAASAPNGVGDNTGQPRIVLVEDTHEIGLIIQKLAQRSGQRLTWFTTAEEALVHLRDHGAELLLFDVNLPGMSGIELSREVRRFAHLDRTPLALFSQAPQDLDKLRGDGVNLVLSKELLTRPAEWQQRIRHILDRPAAAVAAAD